MNKKLFFTQILVLFSGISFACSYTNSENTRVANVKDEESTVVPTKSIILEYAVHGVADSDNTYLSKEFSEVLRLMGIIPSDNPGGISSYDEIMWNWEDDGESDCEESGFFDAEILDIKNNYATGILKYRTCSGTTNKFNVILINEKVLTPSGKEIEQWVVDDYDGKKKVLLQNLEEAYNLFKNGLGQRLMNDPDESGFMSDSEKKEYLNSVNIFLNSYNKFKTEK